MNILHNCDCKEIMKSMENKQIDLAIIDVPYGIGMDGGSKYRRGKDGVCKQNEYKPFGDNQSPDQIYFNELFRISKNQIIWGANHFISKIPYDSPAWIVWDKLNGDYTGADCELAWTSYKIAIRKFVFRWAGMIQGNMKNKEHRIHPTQKPVALYKWLLTNYAKPGYKLFDSHSGSGSFRIAAYDMGFDLVSCELDADYCRDNEARFQRHIQQQELFTPEEIQEKIYHNKELFKMEER